MWFIISGYSPEIVDTYKFCYLNEYILANICYTLVFAFYVFVSFPTLYSNQNTVISKAYIRIYLIRCTLAYNGPFRFIFFSTAFWHWESESEQGWNSSLLHLTQGQINRVRVKEKGGNLSFDTCPLIGTWHLKIQLGVLLINYLMQSIVNLWKFYFYILSL